MAEITAGNIVWLKSGGPAMTVAGLSQPGKLICHWFGGDSVMEFTFDIHELSDVKISAGSQLPKTNATPGITTPETGGVGDYQEGNIILKSQKNGY